MQQDIVERIKNRLHDLPMEIEHLLDEAADEIERLRQQLAQQSTVHNLQAASLDIRTSPGGGL
jgi:hypothetical protein